MADEQNNIALAMGIIFGVLTVLTLGSIALVLWARKSKKRLQRLRSILIAVTSGGIFLSFVLLVWSRDLHELLNLSICTVALIVALRMDIEKIPALHLKKNQRSRSKA